MELTYLGANSVRLTAKDFALISDPVSAKALGPIKQSADVVVQTQAWDGELPAKTGMVIDLPGEYEVKGAMITGVPVKLHSDDPEAHPKGTAYVVAVNGVHVGIVGNAAPLSSEAIGALGTVDVLVLPVGGHGYTLEPEEAVKLVSQLEPKLVVPVHYADPALKYEVQQAELDVFLKEMGATGVEPTSKLKIAAKDLPEETKVVVVSRAS